ncbi:MAG: hypothetical protein JW952_06855 [Candidatus Eisenbacteria bacterium]|nr:hypothetical protein [Candidatus Eisenbacteria bacterium]
MAKFGVCVFEDRGYRGFLPLSYSRAVFELRCGMLSLWEKTFREYGDVSFYFAARPYLAEVLSERLPFPVNRLQDFDGDGMLFVNGRLLSPPGLAQLVPVEGKSCSFFADGELLACRLEAGGLMRQAARPGFFLSPDAAQSLAAGLPRTDVVATLLTYTWELVNNNPGQIGTDFERSRQGGKIEGDVDERAVVYNARAVHVGQGASIDAGVVLDARGGPIFLGANVKVHSPSRVEGPCVVSEDTLLVGGRYTGGCTFGPCCRIGGEVEQSIFQGHSNKYHEGFVGHSYVGEWVNLGALTTTSDLKNTYGSVSVIVDGRAVGTNLMKVGSLVGDFTKTGIGTLLDTGAVLGFSANVFGGKGVLPKDVPCFVWGDGESFETYIPQRAVATARVMMERRGTEMSPALERLMMRVFEATEEDRRRVL